jgi:hypothetical protein
MMKSFISIVTCWLLLGTFAQAQTKPAAPGAAPTVTERAASKTERLGKFLGLTNTDQLGRCHEAAEEYYKKLDEAATLPNLTDEQKKVKYIRANQAYEGRVKSVLQAEYHDKLKQFLAKEKVDNN